MSASRWITRRVMEAFDRWAPTYEGNVVPKLVARGYSYPELARIIASALNVSDGSLLLELGVGSGVLGKEIMRLMPVRIAGIDLSRQMLRIARATGVYAPLCQCSAEDVPLSDESVDGIYSAFMLHSVIDQMRALREMYRVTKPHTRIVVVDLCPDASGVPCWTLLKGNLHSIRYEHGAPSRYQSADDCARMLERANFRVCRVERLGKRRHYTHYLFEAAKGGYDGWAQV